MELMVMVFSLKSHVLHSEFITQMLLRSAASNSCRLLRIALGCMYVCLRGFSLPPGNEGLTNGMSRGLYWYKILNFLSLPQVVQLRSAICVLDSLWVETDAGIQQNPGLLPHFSSCPIQLHHSCINHLLRILFSSNITSAFELRADILNIFGELNCLPGLMTCWKLVIMCTSDSKLSNMGLNPVKLGF